MENENKKEKIEKTDSLMNKVKTFIAECREKYLAFKRKRRQKRYENGEVDLPVFRVGPNKKGIAVLWGLMVASLVFGVYKNFTAIDKETIYETTVVEAAVTDTNAVESFVERFAYLYHAWGSGYEAKNVRQESLSAYMTDELVSINNNAVNSDCPTVAEVENVRICEVADLNDGDYEVRYSVVQRLTESAGTETADIEKKDVPVVATGEFKGTLTGETAEDREDTQEESAVSEETAQTGKTAYETVTDENGTLCTVKESFYIVVVHVDEIGDMVIIKNPTVCGAVNKSEYVPATCQNDGNVDTETMAEVEEFLNTFFTLYPTATESELMYYAKPDLMDVISENFVYGGLMNPVYYLEDNQLKVHAYVKYLDQTAKMTQIAEYTLTLEKGDNWKIVDAK